MTRSIAHYRIKITALAFMLACLTTSGLDAQLFKNPFKKDTSKPKLPPIHIPGGDIPNKLRIWAEWINSIAAFQQAVANLSKMNSKEFGKHTTVVKATPGNKPVTDNIPARDITKPEIKKGEFSNLFWEPVAYFNNQLFPSAIISLAGYKGESPDTLFEAIRRPLGFRIASKYNNIPLRWEIECVDKNYFDKVGGTFLYTHAGEKSITLFNADSIPWNYQTLMKTKSPTPVNFFFRLFDEKGQKVEKLVTLTMRSINDCVTYYNEENLTDLFSAYVQEDDLSKIDPILREAVNSKIVGQFVGYQFNRSYGSTYVDLQVAAIWKVLHDRGFTYTSITDNSAINTNVAYSQTVRTFDNSMATSQANCVDGSVVFASVLKKIGIRTALVSVPGHCFLAYYANDPKESPIVHFLETTMLSEDNYISKDSVDKYKNKIAGMFPRLDMNSTSLTSKEYLLQFMLARFQGEYNWTHYTEKYPAAQYPGAVRLIDVNEKRLRYQPLPFYE